MATFEPFLITFTDFQPLELNINDFISDFNDNILNNTQENNDIGTVSDLFNQKLQELQTNKDFLQNLLNLDQTPSTTIDQNFNDIKTKIKDLLESISQIMIKIESIKTLLKNISNGTKSYPIDDTYINNNILSVFKTNVTIPGGNNNNNINVFRGNVNSLVNLFESNNTNINLINAIKNFNVTENSNNLIANENKPTKKMAFLITLIKLSLLSYLNNLNYSNGIPEILNSTNNTITSNDLIIIQGDGTNNIRRISRNNFTNTNILNLVTDLKDHTILDLIKTYIKNSNLKSYESATQPNESATQQNPNNREINNIFGFNFKRNFYDTTENIANLQIIPVNPDRSITNLLYRKSGGKLTLLFDFFIESTQASKFESNNRYFEII